MTGTSIYYTNPMKFEIKYKKTYIKLNIIYFLVFSATRLIPVCY